MSIEPLDGNVRRELHGGKAAQLGQALRAGLPVPPGFALSHVVVDQLVSGLDSHRARLAAMWHGLGGPVAVRSSAVDEDGMATSFAGVHETVLQQHSLEDVEAAIIAVHASGRTPAALGYRQHHRISSAPTMGVVVQRMVVPRVAGVLFTRDPVSGRDVRVIEAAWGLGEVVVNGTVEPDRIHMGRDGVIHSQVAGDKDTELVVQGGVTVERAVEADRRRRLCLGDGDLRALVRLAFEVEEAFGPREAHHHREATMKGQGGIGHDVEFAIDDEGRLWLLQRREITR